MIKTTVKSWHMVQPAVATTPRHDIWVSSPDLLGRRGHATCVYFYRPTGSDSGRPNFCSMDALKDALSKVLVPFYPLAGRLKKDPDGRIEINCNGEGAVLVEVVTDFDLDYFGDFKSTMELKKLIPEVNCSSQDISSYPLLLLQVTFFKCGGVSLGVAIHHIVVDGYSGFNFIKSWSEVVRGLDISLPPYLDRSLLGARDPPTPKFHHIEYEPPPTLNIKNGKINGNHSDCSVAMFTITKEQLDNLKAKAIENGYKVKYTSYELLSAHVWRCVSKARNLAEDQESKIYINTNARSRLRPPLPPGYFGNAVFMATPMALAGDIISKPVYHAASIIHEALIHMDDEYLRSALDYLELQPKDLTALARGAHTFRAPNMCITSWCWFPIQDADFGWGRPIFLRPAAIGHHGIGHEGHSYILPSPTDDGSLSVALGLQADHMDSFRKLIYEF